MDWSKGKITGNTQYLMVYGKIDGKSVPCFSLEAEERNRTSRNRFQPHFTIFHPFSSRPDSQRDSWASWGWDGWATFSGCFRPNLCVVLIASNSWHLTIQHYPTINPSTHHLASVGHSPGSGASASVRMDLRCFPRFWSHRAWWGQKLDVDPSGTGRLQRHCFPCRLWT